ncbi:glutamate racemase [Siculibacillus lacustris]|uniref:Glutamate racemase n=1 Tax=Siculibacillus lacustris TaxID=1549641 RepID=A0A4Q9VQS7_9HYPH|nr:glutamate racemase [Siculibacillus lacustris]TBW38199.1 glutamate racemase [Siculibacillus lacustris]
MTQSLPSATPVPPRLVVFDSGIGGLSVAREIRAARPDAEIVYVADDAGFPYGERAPAELAARIVDLAGRLIADHRPDLFVIACNTASTLVLPPLRRAYDVAFVGTVPAIKPAAASTRSGLISILATPGTVRRDYTRALIDTYASHLEVTLVGSTRLAALAEAELAGEPVDAATVAAEIDPCFRARDGRRTDRVVLACTHYPFLIEHFRRTAPWPVEWIDPAPAIARRVTSLIGPAVSGAAAGGGRALFTSGRSPGAALAAVLATLGLICAPG